MCANPVLYARIGAKEINLNYLENILYFGLKLIFYKYLILARSYVVD